MSACQRLFVDLGANVGVNARFLYEPALSSATMHSRSACVAACHDSLLVLLAVLVSHPRNL
tara:strand:+ start:211 stop:393 length:183 start_codon:yes stop_codon:yes gene_type:complete